MEKIPAAQYLRMSTERQEYSIDCQAAGISAYALEHGFEICQTYRDEAKSGLDLVRRTGLSQLLRDVVGGKQVYKAVLVYDVSRWGRFQTRMKRLTMNFCAKLLAYASTTVLSYFPTTVTFPTRS